MNSLQRVIKYCAIAFAIILAVGIMSFVVNAVFGVVNFTSGRNFNFNTNSKDIKTIDYSDTFTEVKSLTIDNSTGELRIRVGDSFKVEAENVFEGFSAEVSSNGELTISDNESKFQFFGIDFNGFNSPNSKITIYVPADFIAEEVKIETGAGAVSLEGLNTEYLYIFAGAGNIKGSKLTADEVEVEGGVGSVNLSEVNFNDTEFDCGVGNVSIEGVLIGDNEFDCGVGEVKLNLVGDIEDYDLDIDSGVGTVRVNGEKIGEGTRRNSFSDYSIKVDGGVGNVSIDIEE
jgi:DUF4097 and DUF4098 domain-containing protein YvlB